MWHMDAGRGLTSATHLRYTGQERRITPRIETPFPATVRSVDVDNQPFEEHTVIDNLSSGGLYLRLVWPVQCGIRLFVLIRLSVVPKAYAPAAYIALHGAVLRIEPRPGGVFGTAIRLVHHRFIYAATQSIAHGAACWPSTEEPDFQTESILKGGG